MITIIDYDMGNINSIANMLRRLGAKAETTSNPEHVARAERIILPGVGAFDTGMKNLEAAGLLSVLNQRVVKEKTPVLGICLGCRLITRGSEEGELPGLRWIQADTVRFKDVQVKIPHMGWNTARPCRTSMLFPDAEEKQRFYFVHSYHLVCDREDDVLLMTHHGYEFASAVSVENITGVQFHPEKSHKYGLRLFERWLES